jgi:poly-gamma-glutamate synthase PgsB/CapB
MNESQFAEIINYGLSAVWQRIYVRHLKYLYKNFNKLDRQAVPDTEFVIIDYLYHEIAEALAVIARHNKQFDDFNLRYKSAASANMEKRFIIDYAKNMGASKQQLVLDQKAFSRWMGYDVMDGRHKKLVSESEQYLVFLLDAIARLVSKNIKAENSLKISFPAKLLDKLLYYTGDERIKIAALQALKKMLNAVGASGNKLMDESQIQFIYYASLNHDLPTWVQTAALDVLALSSDLIDEVLAERLGQNHGGDDLFVRHNAVGHFVQRFINGHGTIRLLQKIAVDESDYVRQKLALELRYLTTERGKDVLRQLLFKDEVDAVKASALLSFTSLSTKPLWLDILINFMQKCINEEESVYVLRAALHICACVMAALVQNKMYEEAGKWQENIEPAISHLHEEAASLAIRRYAAQVRESLWVYSKKWRLDYFNQMREKLLKLAPYQKTDADISIGEDEAFRVMSRFASKDFGFDINFDNTERLDSLAKSGFGVANTLSSGAQNRSVLNIREDSSAGMTSKSPAKTRLRVKRWQSFGLRLWRVLHEVKNPSIDKREGFTHSVARKYAGNIQLPSECMAELSETKVPGEPLFIETEGGYRPYVPLPDMVISSLKSSKPVKIFTSEGITEIYPPQQLKMRIKAYFTLSRNFSDYAKLRNWQEYAISPPSQYLVELSKLGFSFSFSTYADDKGRLYKADKAVMRFFPAFLPLPLIVMWGRFEDYFATVYQNTLTQLVIFMLALSAYFVGKQLFVGYKIRKIRAHIPLVIGGWGTRGKSGTERIKAALFSAMGFSVISKTTGCEAMLLHSYAYSKLRELFLFRSYDKATIWEQVQVLTIANKLGADVMLWECMGLTPTYVRIMQRSWMRDDISTITNTYPDHEDIQGPAGINIAEVMTNFIPQNSVLVTSEEQMLPILKNAANNINTKTVTTGWLAAGMITPDIKKRFPYEEHPHNIALVLKMAEELGISEAFALKEMADNVVLDLGVLKSYPIAKVMGRKLEFTNGMSANERLATLNNWNHAGFARQNHVDTPHIWTGVVINNRADRNARSQVFASIIVNDISADRFYLIGTNLDGLENYIEKAWREKFKHFTLEAEGKTAIQIFEGEALRIFVPTTMEIALKRTHAMLNGVDAKIAQSDVEVIWQIPDLLSGKIDPLYEEDCKKYIHNLKAEYEQYHAIKARLNKYKPGDDMDAVCKKQLGEWFKKRLYKIEDKYTSGNELITILAKDTPPGLFARIMGMQNIKGTGLDFVYAWQNWELCSSRMDTMRSDNLISSQKAAMDMVEFDKYNVLCVNKVNETISFMQNMRRDNDQVIREALSKISQNMQQCLNSFNELVHLSKIDKFIVPIRSFVEELLDSVDAVRRRKKANSIYNDLVNQRISHDRAIAELAFINKRQQGGWL